MRPLDVFIYNVYFTSFALALVYLYAVAVTVSHPRHLVPGVLLAGILAVFPVAAYALLSVRIPRAGGDYAYVGQVLHPALGFLCSWNWAIWLCFWIGFGAYSFPTVGLRGVMTALALVLGRPDFLRGSAWLDRPGSTLLLGTGVILGFGVVASLGIGLFLRIQRWTFLLATSAVLVLAGSLATTDQAQFRARFDALIRGAVGVPQAYDILTRRAPTPTRPDGSVLTVVPAAFLVLPWTVGTTFITPELKDFRRNQPLGMLSALGAVTLATAGLGGLLVRTTGSEFLTALVSGAGEELGIPVRPYFHDLVFLLLDHPVTFIVAALGFLCLGWMYLAQNMISNARILMVWAHDGLIPQALGEVHPSLHTPWRGILAVCAASEVFLVLLCYTPYLHVVSSILALTLSALMVSVSAVILPIRRPYLSAAEFPCLPLVGVLGTASLVLVDGYYLLDPRYGARNAESLLAVGGVLALGLAYWTWRSWCRTR